MKKRIAALTLAALMALGVLPGGMFQCAAARAYLPSALSYGDYFVLGRYLGEEIVWRHVGSNGYGDVALSFRVLTSKAYNSKGIKPANVSVPDGVSIPQEVDPRGDRADFGSNLWVNSTLRAWLNSDAPAGAVGYVGAAPASGQVTANAYDGEAGFLSSFSEAERAAMVSTRHAAALNEVDSQLRTAGTQVPGWDNGLNLTDPLRHMVTDTIFLPDAHLLSRIAGDSQLDWTVGYWSTGFHRAGITASAVAQAGPSAQTPSGEYSAVDYWTGTPQGSQWGGTHQMQIRLVGGGHSFVNVNEGVMGVRPAFYLNHDKIVVTGGSGTQDDPYTIGVLDGSFGVSLKGDTGTKRYTPAHDTLQITAVAVPDLQLSYIMVDPESGVVLSGESDFNGYHPVSLPHTGGKASLPVDRNCAVWVMAKGTVGGSVKTAFASIKYQNFYEPVKIYQQGKPTGEDAVLYHATLIPGVYGVPVNSFRSALLGGVPYDEISVLSQADALPSVMQGFWARSSASATKIVLNDINYFTGQQTVTMRYDRVSDRWVTVNFYFVDESGNPIPVQGVAAQPVTKTDWIPQGMSLSQVGAHYDVPAAENSSLTPYLWRMYDAADTSFSHPLYGFWETDGDESVGFDPKMPENLTNVAIRIYYKGNQHIVTERHVTEDTGDLLRTNAVSIEWGHRYHRASAPGIDHYVVTGYQIGGGTRESLLFDSDGKPQWGGVSFPVTGDTTVTYFYASDANGDGVPDSDQVQLKTRWIGVYPDARPNVPIQPDGAQTVRRGTAVTVSNDGLGGDAQHRLPAASPAQWIFDPASGSASQTLTPSADTAVHFYYRYDSKGTGVPDADQGVTAKFAVYDGVALSNPQNWQDMFTGVVQGGTYLRAVPSRTGYVAVGWILDGDSPGALLPFSGRNGNQAEFQTTAPNHTVTFVYRAAAAPVTVRWVGTALTGNLVEFGHVSVTGYAGETIPVSLSTLRESVSVDAASWVWNPAKTTVPDTLTFSDTPQEFVFHFDELLSFAYDVHCLSTDGKTLFEEKIPATSADPPFVITARAFPLYVYERYEILEFGSPYASGTDDAVTLTPAQGAMSVYFYYAPSSAEVLVRHFYRDGGGAKVVLKEYSVSASAGTEYTAYAEVFPGFHATAPSATIDVTGGTGNLLELEYTDVRKTITVQLSKNGGAAEGVQTFKVPAGTVYPLTPPHVDGYTFAGYEIGGVYTDALGLATIDLGPVTDDLTVTLRFVSFVNYTIIGKRDDASGTELFRYIEQVRHGQAFSLSPADDLPKLDLWRLKDGQSAVQIGSAAADQTFEFYYESKLTTVTVNAVLAGGGSVPGFTPIVIGDILTGSVFRYDAPYLPGYRLAEGEAPTQTIDAALASGNTITFVYEALPTGEVHVLLKEDDTNGRIIAAEEHALALGYSMQVPVPDLSAMFYTALSTEQTVTYTGTDITVEYYYERDTVQVVKKTFYKADENNPNRTPIETFEMGRFRVGTNARFYAPSKELYELDDAALKLVRILPPASANARAVYYHEVSFFYSPIGSGRLVVEAVNESGGILLSYHVAGTDGESIPVGAPVVPGYRLRPGEPSSQTGRVPGKVTFTYQREDGAAFADLTVAVKSANGAGIAGAEVAAKSEGMTIRSNMTDASGKIVLTDLPAGTYTVAAKRAGYNDGAASVDLTGDRLVEITLTQPGGSGGGGGGGGGGGSGGGGAVQPPPEEETDADGGGLLEKAVHVNYISGFDDGTVRPEALISRAETAVIFYRLLAKTPDPGDGGFFDVTGGAWYAEAVNALAAAGIVNGYPDGAFRPEHTITRAEFTAIVSRLEGLEPSDERYFRDVDAGHWAAAYIQSAYQNGWVSGYPDGGFWPDRPITRAEAVTLVNRVLDRRVRPEDIPGGVNRFIDLSASHWAYAAILEAATAHDYRKDEAGYEIWELAE